MIAVMDEVGFAQFASIGNVAHRARVTNDEACNALVTLESPDPASSDPANEGKRLEKVPGGWLVLNAEKHRSMVSRIVVQEQTRARVRKFRERLKTDHIRAQTRARVTKHRSQKHLRAESRVTSHGVTHSNVLVTLSNGRNDNQNQNQSTDPSLRTGTSEAADLLEKAAAPPPPSPSPHDNGKHPPKGIKPDGRSKRPIFTGQRLTVFEWMFDKLTQMLGKRTDAFGLDDWFYTLDARAVEADMVLPPKDGGDWLLAETFKEAHRRGLPIAVTDVPTRGKLSSRLAAALAEIQAEDPA